jgi:hypothetical protein
MVISQKQLKLSRHDLFPEQFWSLQLAREVPDWKPSPGRRRPARSRGRGQLKWSVGKRTQKTSGIETCKQVCLLSDINIQSELLIRFMDNGISQLLKSNLSWLTCIKLLLHIWFYFLLICLFLSVGNWNQFVSVPKWSH